MVGIKTKLRGRRKLDSILETLQLSNEFRPVLSINNKGELSICVVACLMCR